MGSKETASSPLDSKESGTFAQEGLLMVEINIQYALSGKMNGMSTSI